MPITPEMIMQVRYEVQDVDVALPILDDAVYEYILTKNAENIARSSIDAARMILQRLSLTASKNTVDIFSIDSTVSAKQYKEALLLYIKDPNLNPLYQNLTGSFGGISKSEMQENDDTSDNNLIPKPNQDRELTFNFTF
jgi:hypothetical protein